MTKINKKMRDDMHARRLAGESPDIIAASYGLKPMTVYQHLCRHFGLDTYRSADLRRSAANDNNPDRTTHLAPHNGGCSTLSGLMPVSLPRVLAAANDNAEDLAAGQAVNDYALRSEQVAA